MTQPASYTDWRYERGCLRKVAYPSLAAAARSIIAVREHFGHKVTPYQCQFCGNWHLTHSSNQQIT